MFAECLLSLKDVPTTMALWLSKINIEQESGGSMKSRPRIMMIRVMEARQMWLYSESELLRATGPGG